MLRTDLYANPIIDRTYFTKTIAFSGILMVSILTNPMRVDCTVHYVCKSVAKNQYVQYIPGQGTSSQLCALDVSPTQSVPPCDGAGLVQSRVLFCAPLPHVTEHVSQAVQSLNPPFT